MIFTDMDRDHGSEIKVTRKSRLEWWWRAGEHIIIRFYLNFIETFCLFLLHSFFLLGVCSAPIDHNKTNEKDNWVWRIKNYRYDIGESSPDIEYHRCRMHFSCCCCRSRSSASWLSETRSRYWWLNKDNHIAASAILFRILMLRGEKFKFFDFTFTASWKLKIHGEAKRGMIKDCAKEIVLFPFYASLISLWDVFSRGSHLPFLRAADFYESINLL